MRMFTRFLLAASLLAAAPLFAADPPAAAPLRKVAIIVENRAGAQLNDKVAVFEDLLSSRISGKGYSIISRDVTVNALKTYPSVGVAVSSQSATKANTTAAAHAHSTTATSAHDKLEQATVQHTKENDSDFGSYTNDFEASTADTTKYHGGQTNVSHDFGHGSASVEMAQSDSAKIDVTPDTTRLDQALSDSTTALRLAQNLGADFILIPSLTTYGTERKAYTGNGINTVNVTHTLRVSCKIVEAGAGGALKGDMVTASKTIRQSGDLQVDSSDIVNDLLDDAAGRCPPRWPRTSRLNF